jgi:hypothetical protein
MPRFEITAPDGRLFEVTAPEGASQAEVLAYAQQNFGKPSTTLGQKALGVGETALTASTGIIGQLLGNVAGVGKEFATGDFGKGTAEKTAQQVQQALTYQPRGQVAPEYLQNIQSALETSPAAKLLAPTPLLPNAANIGFKTRAAVPTAQEIKSTASQMYKTIDDAGVVIKAEPFNQFVNKVKTTIGGKVREARQPQVVDALKQLDEASGSVKTLQKMQDLRESISGIKMSGNASERMFAGDIVKELDDFIDNLDASKLISPVKGDVEAIKLVPQARELWKQARKSEMLDEIYRKAGIRATDAYDDVAFATKLRAEFKNLATNKTKLRGFTEEEVKAIEQAAKGGRVENALRAFGQGAAGDKFSATGAIAGGGLSSLAFGPEFGNAIAGPIGAIIGAKTMPALKGASRSAAGALGRQNLQNVMDLVKTSGNPYSGVQLAPFFKLNPITGTTMPANALNAAGLLAPYITNPDDLKSLLGQ